VMSLPRLLDSLREGMSLVGSTQQEMDAVIDALEPIHMACLRGETPVKEHKAAQTAKAPDTDKGSSADVAELIRSIREEVRSGVGQKTSAQGDAIADNAGDLDEALVDSASSFADEEAEVASGDDNIEDEFTTLAAEMTLGAWLEFAMDDGKKRRGKLAWKSVVMGEYVFVDRRYKVVAERTLSQLAADLRYGRAAPLEDVPVFDRALDKVLNGLMTSGSAAH